MREQLVESGVSKGGFNKAVGLITSFLKNKLDIGGLYVYPQPETVSSGGSDLVGIRFFGNIDGNDVSFRLNWASSISSMGLVSVDYWGGSSARGRRLVLSGGASLAKTLPMIADLLLSGFVESSSKVTYIEESIKIKSSGDKILSLVEARDYLTESIVITSNIQKTIRSVLGALVAGKSEGDQYREGGSKVYGPGWSAIVKVIKNNYPEIYVKDGRKTSVDIKVAKSISEDDIVALLEDGKNSGMVSGTLSTTPKEDVTTGSMTADELEQLSYRAQLESLRAGVKLLMSGASNALFIAGRGGTGKTQNVEDELGKVGLSDGDGYTVIKGAASTAGLYRAFYQNRNGILFFDDADGALSDQDSRNLFKAACDTKPTRKLSWQKGGANYVDPDDYDEEDENKLPRSFEFKGKVIFISNLSMNKLDPDGALRTRAFIIPIDPVDQDMIDFMKEIAHVIKLDVNYVLDSKARDEVVDIIAERVSHVDSTKSKLLNLRMLVRALNTRAGIESQGGTEEEWKNFVKRFI